MIANNKQCFIVLRHVYGVIVLAGVLRHVHGVRVLAGVRVLSLSLRFLGDGTGGSGEGVSAAIVVWDDAKGGVDPADIMESDIMEVDMLQGEDGGGILKVPSLSALSSWPAATSNSSAVMFMASCISLVAAAMKSGSQCLPRPCSLNTLPTRSRAGLMLPLAGPGLCGGGVMRSSLSSL